MTVLNAAFEDILLNLEIAAGVVADLDSETLSALDAVRDMLERAGRDAKFPEGARENLQGVLSRVKALQEDPASFETHYGRLCHAMETLQRAAESAGEHDQPANSFTEMPSNHEPDQDAFETNEKDEFIFSVFSIDMNGDAEPAGQQHSESEPAAATLSPADVVDLELQLDVLGGIIGDLDADSPHVLDVIGNIGSKIFNMPGLTKSFTAPCERMRAAAADLASGAVDFETGALVLSQAYEDLGEAFAAATDSGAPEQGDDNAAIAFPEPDTALSPALADFLDHGAAALDDFESAILAYETGGEIGEPARAASALGAACRKAGLVAAAGFLESAARALNAGPDCGSTQIANALLSAKDALHAFFTALAAGDTCELDEAELNRILNQLTMRAQTQASVTRAAESATPVCTADFSNPEMQEFVSEGGEYIESAELCIMQLEKDPANSEHLNEIFRCFHNIKGITGFLQLTDINELAHHAESMMDKARTGKLAFQGAVAQAAFEALDMFKDMLSRVAAAIAGQPYETPAGYAGLVRKLKNPETFEVPAVAPVAQPASEVSVSSDNPQRPAEAALVRAASNGSVKVGTERLDALIDAVGELVIANAMVSREISQQNGDLAHTKLHQNAAHLGKITRELQELAMSMRMVSLRGTFQKMQRVARDISVKSGCPVEFTYSGEDTELDRNVVEEITSPLVHMVRNAVDHGIEPPAERRLAGKPEAGRVHLDACHAGGSVIIRISDDGRGLDRDAILAKARRLGLADASADLNAHDIHALIFHPGFSTAKQVTDISGRGVGMDVVKKNIEKLRGRIDIESEPGRGTSFIVRLPLTLAIIDGMLVSVAGERYIIPTTAIQESLRPAPEKYGTALGRGEMLNVRGDLVPLFRLHKLFSLDGAQQDPMQALTLIIGDGAKRCALLVDDLLGQQQVVIKSLGRVFDAVDGVSGGAILGDGRVALILDTAGLVRAANAENAK
jgi:two-component system chemotaxis sensor kinase CheA